MPRVHQAMATPPSWALPTAISVFAIYTVSIAPSVGLLDASELAAAGFSLGISHPPGHPLSELWMRAFQYLPLGSLGFRAGLSQAFAGAVAVFAFVRMAEALGGALAFVAHYARPLAIAAALTFALSGSFGMQTV